MKVLERFDPVIALLRIIQKKSNLFLANVILILKTGRKKPLNVQQHGLNSGHLLAA